MSLSVFIKIINLHNILQQKADFTIEMQKNDQSRFVYNVWLTWI